MTMLLTFYERLNNIEALLADGMCIHTDYSGKSPEISLNMLSEAFRKHGVTLPDDWLVFWRAADIMPMCQTVIAKGGGPPMRCFGGLV